jgi:AcrR family transcriptional regulator
MQQKRLSAARPQSKRRKRWNGFVAGHDEQHERKRLAILDQSAKLFSERGYYETSIADIAASLHVTKPTLYYYVENKEDILTQLIERAIENTEALAVRARAEGKNSLERLRLFVRGYVELGDTNAGRCLVTLRRIPVSAAMQRRIAAGYRRIDALGRAFIAEGVADGSVRDCDVRIATFALFGAVNWVPNWFHRDGAMSAGEAGDALFDILASGLARGKSATPRRSRNASPS